jgi:spore coat protein U-like protein
MKSLKPVFIALLGATAIGVFGASSASAVTATTTFQVTANVLATCTISAGTLAFGNYTGLVQVASTTTLTATCTDTTAYNVALNAGVGIGATELNRLMTDASMSHTIPYSLYRDAGHTLNWGNTIGIDTLTGTGNGLAQVLTVYGVIPTGAFVEPGSDYTDTISVTLTY